jgi:anti-sigma factor RsiW
VSDPDEDDILDTDEELSAFLDGELDGDRTRELSAEATRDPKLRGKLDEYQKTWELLDHLPKAEPSANFTERTLSRVEPLPALPSVLATTIGQSALVAPPVPNNASTFAAAIQQRSRPRWFWPTLVIIGVVAGFAGKRLIAPATLRDDAEQAGQIVRDVRILRHLELYRHVDDFEFLKALGEADYFGDEGRD